MKVLFICSGKNGAVSEITKNQGNSLLNMGIKVDYFIINSGIYSYISSIPKIRKVFKKGNYNLAHAHYSLSAFAASLAGRFPLVVSLMGSDVYMSSVFQLVTKFFIKHRWDATIVKNRNMKETLGLSQAFIIPNGVNLERFKPMSKSVARKHLNFSQEKRIVSFIAYQNRPEKNLDIAKSAVCALSDKNIELKHIYNVANESIPYYLNASDMLLLTSQWEGSPNVIKEAMACNSPIVATNVGDIEWIIGNTEGCYLTSFDLEDISDKINSALSFNQRTKGRDRLIELGLDSASVAEKLIEVYEGAINSTNKHNY